MREEDTICEFCGEPRVVDLFEVWGREFMIETCCEAVYEIACEAMQEGSREEWVRSLFRGYGIPCRGVVADDRSMTLSLDHGLSIADISFQEAAEFISEHHEHHKPPVGWRWGHGLINGPDLVGVCTVGRPVARMIDATKTVEVNRLCVRRDLASGLTWNGCSMLYGAAAREARRRGYERIITYTLEHESGTSLLAAGWVREQRTAGGRWSRGNRRRAGEENTGRKWRYGRRLMNTDGVQQGSLF